MDEIRYSNFNKPWKLSVEDHYQAPDTLESAARRATANKEAVECEEWFGSADILLEDQLKIGRLNTMKLVNERGAHALDAYKQPNRNGICPVDLQRYTKELAMNRKIALEEHIESPDFPATGTHTDASYFEDVENRLQEYKLRLEDMDATGIETSILSLTQPGVEGITQTKLAIHTAKKMNDHMANFFVKNRPSRFHGFAAVPLQDPAAAAEEL
jgi:hypothetical protein